MSDAYAGVSFPPEPWRLFGRLYVSGWLVRAEELPQFEVPPGFRSVTLGGRLAVGGAWGVYHGDLAYRELALGLLLRRGARLAVTLPWIWVDSPASVAGGRALWSIPKAAASFTEQRPRLSAEGPQGALATMSFAPRLSLPGWRRLQLSVVQPRNGGVAETPACVDARMSFGRARWRGFRGLAALSRPPLFSVLLEPAEMTFGRPLPARRRRLR